MWFLSTVVQEEKIRISDCRLIQYAYFANCGNKTKRRCCKKDNNGKMDSTIRNFERNTCTLWKAFESGTIKRSLQR